METPIYDFLKNYSESGTVRLHMPGHKGSELKALPASFDITEITGADSLFEAGGIILQSEKNAAELYGCKKTLYSTCGSTLCIQTMLALCRLWNGSVIAVRNVHRSFLSSCVLLGIEPRWIYPKYRGGFLSGNIDPGDVRKTIENTEKPCLYITSPDYLGNTADIASLSSICHEKGGMLIADNAHGAHLAGLDAHPIKQGADMCCDSAHKMLPCLTGGAYLHIRNSDFFAEHAKQMMSLFGSTSPSYLIMASLDLCNDYIEDHLASDRKRVFEKLSLLRKKISKKYRIYDSEPFHLTLLCDGIYLASQLRGMGIECEYADRYCAVLLFSPMSSNADIEKTEKALLSCDVRESRADSEFRFPETEKLMTVREAGLAPYENISLEKALDRICASVNVPCPPAVPIAVPGEKISEKIIEIYRNYGIKSINVVK